MSRILSSNALKNFDWEIYLLNYPELVDLRTEQETVMHYAHVGHLENRSYHIPEVFDWERYLNTYKHLWLNTAREAYIHFMRLGLKYKQEKSPQPIHMLILAQYDRIIEHNQTMLKEPPVPVTSFTLPPRPKNQTSSPEYRQVQAPLVLNPPKQPLKKPRSDDAIADRLQPKIMATTPSIKQQIKTTASSIIKPAPVQKPAPQQRLPAHMWPPRQVEEKRSPRAPHIFQPLKQPSRSSIIHTSAARDDAMTSIRRPAQQPTVSPPLEPAVHKRFSQAPSQFQPLKKPSREAIIHTGFSGVGSPQPPSEQRPMPPPFAEPLDSKRISEAPSQFQPMKKPSRDAIIQTNSKTEIMVRRPEWPPQQLPITKSEKKRSSEAPSPFQPLKHPSRSTLIKTKTTEETIVFTRRPKPASTRYVPDKPMHRPYKHPSRNQPSKENEKLDAVYSLQDNKEPAFSLYPFQPIRKPRLTVKSLTSTRSSQKSHELQSSLPFYYSQKNHVRQPKEGELVLSEPPSKYFSRIGVTIDAPKYLN